VAAFVLGVSAGLHRSRWWAVARTRCAHRSGPPGRAPDALPAPGRYGRRRSHGAFPPRRHPQRDQQPNSAYRPSAHSFERNPPCPTCQRRDATLGQIPHHLDSYAQHLDRSLNIDRSTSVAQLWSLNIDRSTSIAQHRSLNIDRSTSIAQHRSLNIGRLTSVAQHRTLNIGRSTSGQLRPLGQSPQIWTPGRIAGRSATLARIEARQVLRTLPPSRAACSTATCGRGSAMPAGIAPSGLAS
jgi:hypothetical protein